MAKTPQVLIAFAHPDDETFGCGGTTALLTRRGVGVHVLLATDGQAGEITDPALDTPENRADLGALRRAETRAAAAALGTTSLRFLGHEDGGLAELGDEALADEIATAIRELKPDLVITFGPEGIYGHPDHLCVHRATRLAWAHAADPGVPLAGLPPHAASRLFYQVVPKALADGRNTDRGPIRLPDGEHLFVGYPDESLSTRVDATACIDAKLAAMRAHRSQTASRIPELTAAWSQPPLLESYILAERRVADAPGLEGDLLAGIG